MNPTKVGSRKINDGKRLKNSFVEMYKTDLRKLSIYRGTQKQLVAQNRVLSDQCRSRKLLGDSNIKLFGAITSSPVTLGNCLELFSSQNDNTLTYSYFGTSKLIEI